MNNSLGDPLLDTPRRQPATKRTVQTRRQPVRQDESHPQPRRTHDRPRRNPQRNGSGRPARGFAVTALVTGIIGVIFGLIPLLALIALPLGIVAVVFGLIAARRNKVVGAGVGMARAGWILGAVATILAVIGFVIVDQAVEDFGNNVDNIVEDMDESFAVLEAEWHLESEYTDYGNDIDATATAGEVVDGVTEIKVTETGTTNVLATHTVQINDDGTFVVLD